jgi:hypothetical protein
MISVDNISDNFVKVCPNLALPDILYDEILEHISDHRLIASWLTLDATQNSYQKTFKFWQRLFNRWCFGKGRLQIYKLKPELEQKIRDHYRVLISQFSEEAKIRIKSMENIHHMLPPHSDAADGGDTCSIYIPLLTNQEITTWYAADKEFRLTPINWWKLKPAVRLILRNNCACLFNNSAVHSVTNFDPNKKRYGLAISWKTVSYQQLKQANQQSDCD